MDQRETDLSLSSLLSSGIACHLDPIMVNTILKGEFVELEKLLIPTLDDIRVKGDQPGTLVVENGFFEVKGNWESCQIKSFSQWSTAFEVYMAVYLVTHPKETFLMLYYIRTLRRFSDQMAHKGVDSWLLYDKCFRMRKARCGTSMSWGVIDSELYALHILIPSCRSGSELNSISTLTNADSKSSDTSTVLKKNQQVVDGLCLEVNAESQHKGNSLSKNGS